MHPSRAQYVHTLLRGKSEARDSSICLWSNRPVLHLLLRPLLCTQCGVESDMRRVQVYTYVDERHDCNLIATAKAKDNSQVSTT